MDAKVGLVAIGRNEGDRLQRCLESVVGKVERVVYVDSGSTDGSPEMARSLGVEVVDLDLSVPFTAARARNAGFARLQEILPEVEFVQFVDGDCEVAAGWLELAAATLTQKPEVAVVCGRRRERFPEATPYNRLCDIEWDTPVGEALACGGDSMMRAKALATATGFNPSLIAGEEPELCFRLRQQNWKILRLDAEMTLHDAAMTQFGQWWKRTARAGHAFAEGAWMHGQSPERYCVKETRSIWLWGAIVPAISLICLWPSQGWSSILLLAYPLLVLKVFASQIKAAVPRQDAVLYSLSCIVGKFPNLTGVLQFHANRLRGQRSQLIEYK